MVKAFIFIGLFLPATLMGEGQPEENPDPCQTELITKVNQKGLKSIRFYQLPKYYWEARKCQKLQRHIKLIAQNERKQIDRDFQTAYRLQGCATSCTYLAAVSILYFYASQAMKKS